MSATDQFHLLTQLYTGTIEMHVHDFLKHTYYIKVAKRATFAILIKRNYSTLYQNLLSIRNPYTL